ncbi:EAL domain-containing protein [Alteromonadaceae bacterium M269]|nr:EAL domain-containing protein [Alteromonadaceae bacterium M269]
MHSLLKRQITRYLAGFDRIEELQQLLSAVSDAYGQNEQELEILENSLFVTSKELNERNDTLKQQVEELASIQQQLQQSVAMLKATFDATGEYILVFDNEGNLINQNQMGQALIDTLAQKDEKPWHAISGQLSYPEKLRSMASSLKNDPLQDLEGHLEFKDGRILEYHSSAQKQLDKLVGRVWCLRDVTEHKKNEELIQYQAFHDALTALPNRHLLIDRLNHAIQLCHRNNKQLAVMFIDLDNFKKVNDSEGHEEGDRVLIEVAQRLRNTLREQDTLSRHGGDEFVLIIEDVRHQADLAQLAQKLCDVIAQPITLKGRKHYISSSIGISNYPSDDADPKALIRKADMAMYRAKKQGKNTYHFFSSDLESRALYQLEMERELHLAIEEEQLAVYFQPKISLDTNEIYSAEALVRWIDKQGRVIAPDQFIPLAEQSNLINKIGHYVFDKVCKALSDWNLAGYRHICIAVNLSPREFMDTELLTRIQSCLEKHCIEPSQIILEVTESLFLEDKKQVSRIMQQIREMGIRFALDDFGSGYASFDSLQSLPFDYLKVDKRFLKEVTENPKNAAIARSIIQVGKNLELSVIAEGIEDEPALEFVKKQGADIAQGFYFHKPLPTNEFEVLIK